MIWLPQKSAGFYDNLIAFLSTVRSKCNLQNKHKKAIMINSIIHKIGFAIMTTQMIEYINESFNEHFDYFFKHQKIIKLFDKSP